MSRSCATSYASKPRANDSNTHRGGLQAGKVNYFQIAGIGLCEAFLAAIYSYN
jgi:hypothetical protein